MIWLDRIEIESVGSDPVRLAEALLDQLPGYVAPVPIYEIARALDIVSIRALPLRSLEGCLQCDPLKSRGQIIVNSQGSPRRQRFTTAHELAHFLNERHVALVGSGFECTTEDLARASGTGRQARQEIEANTFAIEVLAPRRHLDVGPSIAIRDAFAIAATFEISREAAVRRYVELHPARLAAVFSHNGRIRSIVKGRNFPQTRVWNGDPLPDIHGQPPGWPALTLLCETDPWAWLRHGDEPGLLAQTAFQEDGYATTLLVASDTLQGRTVGSLRA